MSETVIQVDHLSKLYRLGEVGTGTLRHDFNRWWHKLRGKEDPYLKIGETKKTNGETLKTEKLKSPNNVSVSACQPVSVSSPQNASISAFQRFSVSAFQDSSDYAWALKDVSFEVKRGEVLGIIGKNGAGKSTLLKILSRVTMPTIGEVRVKGRIASLLEVGTGFNPELSGRDNIYLNGAILGMRKREIDRKFDEIVDFSGVERYIDTPVKRYSSGMYVRLAFAVAAHLEPEILIVDEVLAVGDAEFQKKCLGKMQDVAGHGRTVLFVSHNMSAVRSLCGSCIWLDNGAIRGSGPTVQTLDNYLSSSTKLVNASEAVLREDPRKEFQVLKARVTNAGGEICSQFFCDQEICLELVCQVRQTVPGLYGYLQISRRDGTVVLVSDSFDAGGNSMDSLSPGLHTLRITLPARSLAPGDYVVFIDFASPMSLSGFIVDSPGDLLSFQITDPTTKRGNSRGGFFATLLSWEIAPCSLHLELP